MQSRVRRRVSVAAVIPAVVVSVALAGCSTSLNDPSGLVEQLYRQNTGETVSSVNCPTEIPIAQGYQFTCTVHAQGMNRKVTLEEMTATANGTNVEIIGEN